MDGSDERLQIVVLGIEMEVWMISELTEAIRHPGVLRHQLTLHLHLLAGTETDQRSLLERISRKDQTRQMAFPWQRGVYLD